MACTSCTVLLTNTPAAQMCGAGRTLVYGSDRAECVEFDKSARLFDAQIDTWTVPIITNETAADAPRTAEEAYPGCREALEVFFCAQQTIDKLDAKGEEILGTSDCNDFRRPFHGNGKCVAFCPAIRDACPRAAYDHCVEQCRDVNFPESAHQDAFCTVLTLSGLDRSLWNEDVLDIMNLFRLEAEADVPLLRENRPFYRSIPARRPAGSSRTTKLDYYMYATRVNGFLEWLIDTDDIDTNGAAAYVSDANFAPYRVNSDWTFWSVERNEWAAQPLRVDCLNQGGSSSPNGALPAHASTWLGGALALLAAVHAARRPRRRAAA